MNFKLLKRCLFLLIGFLITCPAIVAQTDYRGSISGIVVDAESKAPVAGCYVYLSGYTKGIVTNNNGKFRLDNVPNGIYELVLSHISYQKHIEVIEINQKSVSLEVRLGETTTTLETVYVTNVKDLSQRRRNLKKFKEFFFGEDYRPSQVLIENEQDIELIKTAPGIIQSLQDYTLNIDNDFLGYDVSYYLKDLLMSKPTNMVLGFPKFTPKETNNQAEDLYWAENRQRVFNGSIRHFFKALISKTLKEEGFEVYLTKADPEEESEDFYKELEAQRIWLDDEKLPLNVTIYDTETPGIKQINFGEIMEINYGKEFVKDGGFQSSKIKLIKDYIYVYENGVIVNPSSIKLFGQWSKEGVYQMLPSDYVSNDTLVLNDNLEQINTLNVIKRMAEEKPTEKIYLHTHSNNIFPGETLWYKAYLTAGPNHTPSNLSQNIYVELLDENKVVETHIIEADNGLAKGSMELPTNIKPGKYTLRAYTSWMRNNPSDYYFRKVIQIHHPEAGNKLVEDVITHAEAQPDLQFFPEGGQFIAGVRQQVAFKATDQNGLPVELSGVITDNQSNNSVAFSTMHDGMGIVELTPAANTNYTARLQSGKTINIPFIAQSGISLSADNLSSDTNVILTIRSSTNSIDEPMFLIAQTRGWANYTVQFELEKKEKVIQVPKSLLQKGTAHFTIFNQQGLPLAERLVFNQGRDALNIDITTNQNDVSTRGKTEMVIKVTDENGNPLSGSFSMAALQNQESEEGISVQHIDTYLLLTSDLRGYVHTPEYYFNKSNTDRLTHLDLVMRTNGWTRFQWQNLENSIDTPITHKFEKGLDVKGRLLIKGRKKGVKNGTVTFISNNNENALSSVVLTNRKGNFLLTEINPSDKAEVMLKGITSKGSTSVSFKMDSMKRSAPIDSVLHRKLWNTYNSFSNFYPGSPDKFQSNKDLKAANDALHTTNEIEPQGMPTARESIYGSPSYSIQFEELTQGRKGGNVLQYINGRIPGLRMTPDGPVIRGTIASPFGSSEEEGEEEENTLDANDGSLPLVYLDNNRTDYTSITSIPVDLMERLEIFKGPDAMVLGLGAQSGALMFFTKLGSDVLPTQPNGIFNLKIEGYHIAREFYVPTYDRPQDFAPDYRKTVFWEPMITTDKNGLATISYFNTDTSGDITVRFEGLSFSGLAGHTSFNYTVSIKE